MTGSIAPPRGRSFRGSLQTAAAASRLVATLLVAAVSVRFAIAGVEHALGESAANFSDKPASHSAGEAPRAVASRGTEPAAIAGRAPPAVAGKPPPEPGAGGRAVRLTLSVSSGSPRSDVYVNGSRVGNTPFLGDTSCKTGQPVRIEVVPASGPPLTYLRDCRGGSIEISGPPP
ncbi:MAG TPA: hypothetical protein VHE30_02045 [Polyangiaceae bacterium]|nr:hypothetical protein [Polyangiaceae bacterium]